MRTLHDFVKVSDGRIGLIVANDTCGGVFRGHCDVWFGEFCDGIPYVEQLLVTKDWELVDRPIGQSKSPSKTQDDFIEEDEE